MARMKIDIATENPDAINDLKDLIVKWMKGTNFNGEFEEVYENEFYFTIKETGNLKLCPNCEETYEAKEFKKDGNCVNCHEATDFLNVTNV